MKKDIHEKIICAGFGGQGIMLLGKLLTLSGMKEGYNVTWLPSYGAEVRGGTAHSMVHIKSGAIACPTISRPTSCIVMNKPSLEKFSDRVQKGGLLVVNSSMVDNFPGRKDIRIAEIPLTKLALDLGNVKVANMIAAGAWVKLKKLLSLSTVLEAIDRVLEAKKDIITLNKEAVKLGYDKAK